MGLTLNSFDPDVCCLCGSTGEASGEHKVKASLLRGEFGTDKMVIGRFGDLDEEFRPAQGPKSKAFHFRARMCKVCNGTRTQPADTEFDRFNALARQLLDAGRPPSEVFEQDAYSVGSAAYLNVFRYFAKLMCCHMTEMKAPVLKHLAEFAVGGNDINKVWLQVDEDWNYKNFSEVHGDHQYAAHGGLVVYGDKKTKRATAFHSTLTIGPLRYVFFTRLNVIEQWELALFHPKFAQWCRERIEQAENEPMTDSERAALGIAGDAASEK